MKITSRVEGSVRGALLLSCPLHRPRAVPPPRRSLIKSASSPVRSYPTRPAPCAKSSEWLLSTFVPERSRVTSGGSRSRRPRRSCMSSVSAAGPLTGQPTIKDTKTAPAQNKEHLLSLVRDEDAASVQECLEFHRDVYHRGYAAPNGPRIRISERRVDVQYPSHEDTFAPDEDTRKILERLFKAIGQRHRHPGRISLDSIYIIYKLLPEPRMLQFTWPWRSALMKAMGTPRKRNTESMMRYFALLIDIKDAGLTVQRRQWNFALVFAAKYTARVTVREMESTLRLWREMEREYRVPGNEVTFNILFDAASKAGNFALADMIYQEMEERGIEYNRYHHVSLIHYFGLKLDSAGVRAAYREMVEAGEMIDTVVLNCVISGLLRCGEEGSAEDTYERMKEHHCLASELPRRDYMLGKVVSKVIMMFSRVSKRYPTLGETLQSTVPLAPDLHTYKLLVQHYAIRVGNLTKVVRFLDELKFLEVAVHPTIFLALFKGFYLHGGFPGSEWSDSRLHGLLSALYLARDTPTQDFRIDCWLVIWALRAVKKCSTTRALRETFDAMQCRWDVAASRQPFMRAFFENMLRGSDMKSPTGNWDQLTHGRSKKDGSWL